MDYIKDLIVLTVLILIQIVIIITGIVSVLIIAK